LVVLSQGCANFQKIWEPHQNSGRQNGDIKQPQILGATAQNSVAMATWRARFLPPCLITLCTALNHTSCFFVFCIIIIIIIINESIQVRPGHLIALTHHSKN
jgi:hypothetical protein